MTTAIELNIDELVKEYKNFLLENKKSIETGEMGFFGGGLDVRQFPVTFREVQELCGSPLTKKQAINILSALADTELNLMEEIRYFANEWTERML